MTPIESTEAAEPSHKTKSGLKVVFNALLALGVLGPFAVFGAVSVHDYWQSLRAAENRLLSVLELVTGHAESVLKLQALALGAISEKLRGLTDQEILAATASNQRYLRSLRNYAGEILRIFVFDADGKGLLDSDREQIDADVDVSDREFYAWHRLNPGTAMFISGPARSRADGTPVFFLSVRRSGSSGAFQGVVAIGVEQRTFRDYWECFAPERGVAVSLANANGTFLVRSPPIELVSGPVWSARDQLAQMIGGRKERLVSKRDLTDRWGRPAHRLSSGRRFPGFGDLRLALSSSDLAFAISAGHEWCHHGACYLLPDIPAAIRPATGPGPA